MISLPPLKNKQLRKAGEYSSLAVQLIVTVIIFVWGGMKLDAWMENQVPYWTVGLTAFGIFAALYGLFKAVKR